MDVIIGLGIVLMLSLAIFHLYVWKREAWKLTSTHLRSASLMLVCFTLLIVLLFGMRIFLKPEVSVVYNDTTSVIYSSILPSSSETKIVESKSVMVCDVTIKKFYPLSLYMGKDDRTTRYKTQCSDLNPNAKADISDNVSYLKEERRNAGK